MVDTLLILPEDLYQRTTIERFEGENLVVSPYPGKPGSYLSARDALKRVRTTSAARVLIADLRCGAALAALRKAGCHAERIGTRVYGGDRLLSPDDPFSGQTVLEHILPIRGEATGKRDDAQLHRVEAWQRDGWAGLSALGVSWADAQAFVGVQCERKWNEAQTLAQALRRDLDDLTLALAPEELSQGIADAIQSPLEPKGPAEEGYKAEDPCPADCDEEDYEQARFRREPVAVKPLLVLYHGSGAPDLKAVDHLEYRGARARLPWLLSLLDDPVLNHAFDLCLDVGSYRCRLDARLRRGTPSGAIDALVSRLLAVALVTGRPVRHYGCTFYLPLDLHLDEELDTTGDTLPRRLPAELDKRAGIEPHQVPGPSRAVEALSRTISAAKRREERCKIAAGDLTEEAAEAQALLYFLPALQQRIFETDDHREDEDTIRHWRLPLAESRRFRLHIDGPPGNARTKHLTSANTQISDVSLFGYHNDLFVLSIRVELPDEQRALASRLARDDATWWHPLFASSPRDFGAIHALQAEHWLWVTKAARLLRPAFPQQELEGKITRISLRGAGDCEDFDHTRAFSPIVLYLLERLTGQDYAKEPKRLLQVRDDRMVANVAYGLAGPSPGDDPFAREAFERLFSLALFVDRGKDGFANQDGYAYDKEFVRKLLDAQANRRWEAVGTLYGYTNFSNIAMGTGAYFCGPVARVHVPHIYGRMLLLALFFELTFAHFDRLITAATKNALPHQGKSGDDPEAASNAFGRFHQQFLRFTNDHWFHEVTSQTQGAEIFRLQTRALGLEAKYALIKDELERSDDFIAHTHGEVRDKQGHELNKLGYSLSRKATRAGSWARSCRRNPPGSAAHGAPGRPTRRAGSSAAARSR